MAETAGGMTPIPLATQITLTTSVDRHIIPDRNVLGLLEGSDPKLKDEWVLVTAHFDHDGVNGTQILNGADDNGSGTVALLEIADAYAAAAQQGQRPKRSVLFCAWNSEERGLLGAWARSFGFAFGRYQALHPNIKDTTHQQVQRVHRLGRRVHVWTVNAAEDMRRLFNWSVDGIFTDDPALAVQVREESR